jgi:hypothetical protein
MKPYTIFSLLVLLLNLSGVVLQNQLGLRTDLGIFPSSSGGFPSLSLPAEMCRFWGLPLFVGQSGNFVTELVSTRSLSTLHLI